MAALTNAGGAASPAGAASPSAAEDEDHHDGAADGDGEGDADGGGGGGGDGGAGAGEAPAAVQTPVRRVSWGNVDVVTDDSEKKNGRRRSWKGDRKEGGVLRRNSGGSIDDDGALLAAASDNAGVGKTFRSLRKGLSKAAGFSGVLSKKSKPAPALDTRTANEKAAVLAAVADVRHLAQRVSAALSLTCVHLHA